MDNVQMGGESILDNGTPRRAILDTGVRQHATVLSRAELSFHFQTSLIITSTALAASIHARIPEAYQSQSSGVWIIPCSQPSTPTANVFFVIGGRRFGVPLQDLAWKPLDGDGFWCVSGIQVRTNSNLFLEP